MMQDNPIREDWYDSPCFRGTNAREGYARIVRESDRFLEKLGYRREGRVYRMVNPSEERVAVFCHQGFGTTWLSHLLQVPPMLFGRDLILPIPVLPFWNFGIIRTG